MVITIKPCALSSTKINLSSVKITGFSHIFTLLKTCGKVVNSNDFSMFLHFFPSFDFYDEKRPAANKTQNHLSTGYL